MTRARMRSPGITRAPERGPHGLYPLGPDVIATSGPPRAGVGERRVRGPARRWSRARWSRAVEWRVL
ncbi:hypothetical protein [Streptomyces sp. NBC_00151]|uniref:hypothetical protein n=1 Tax=Streptomyces sp. NBC_00151 TaxID=2975669 RepID=UPI002DD7F287|nr:hypothetical protein [Streptomyces sp. NBC_00151]WRZ38748.1 hypothetical protein OG915_12330 [Streptomyces sp. NBC_00151]